MGGNLRKLVTRMPNRTGIVPTADQLAQQERFRLATVYGKAALADPVSRAVYQEVGARRGDPVFTVAVGDFLNAPAVDQIDLADYAGQIGDKIRIRASDGARRCRGHPRPERRRH
jgi:hypothetical protein